MECMSTPGDTISPKEEECLRNCAGRYVDVAWNVRGFMQNLEEEEQRNLKERREQKKQKKKT